MTRTTPVLAVFGPTGNATESDGAVAAALGRETATRHWILLAGGDGATAAGPACTAVKDCAIAGVEEVARGDPRVRWVGVPRRGGPAEPRRSASGHGLVVSPGYGNKRNYVEARLADAAVALAGGPGTGSEVAFCLALGRPVVLVGPAWRSRPLLSDARAEASNAFDGDIVERVVEDSAASPWDRAIDDARRRLVDPDAPPPPVRYWPEDVVDAAAVLDAVGDMLGGTGLTGTFPPSADVLDAEVDDRMWVRLPGEGG